jgi:C-terminal processing protease CtpA/Prc
MLRAALFALCILAAAPLGAQTIPLRNGGFEEGAAGTTPRGWVVRPGVRAELQAEGAAEGRQCVALSLDPDHPQGTFANITQALDAAPWRGKRVRLRAQLRVEPAAAGETGQGQLWLRVDRPEQRRGDFDNMELRPIRSSAWTPAEIVCDVAADARSLILGAMLLKGGGRLWLDAVQLEVLGAAPADPPRPLDARGLGNLVAFARTLGYVRFFHPADAAAAADWERFGREGVRSVESAATTAELALRLEGLFAPLAPGIRFLLPGQLPARPGPPRGAVQAVRWDHHGVGLAKDSIYSSKRVYLDLSNLPADWGRPGRAQVFELGQDLRVTLATVCPVDGERRTLPLAGPARAAAPPSLPPPTGERADPEDRATRLAAVIQAWNVIQHFYPNFDRVAPDRVAPDRVAPDRVAPDRVAVDWPKALETALARTATDASAQAYLLTMRRLLATLQDGHGFVSPTWPTGEGRPGIELTWVGEQLVVCGLEEALKDRLRLGDILVSVDGVAAAALAGQLAPALPASTAHGLRWLQAAGLLQGPPATLELRVQGAQAAPRPVRVERSADWRGSATEPRPQTLVTELQPGICYLDLGRLTRERLPEVLERLAKASAIILDMRGYPVWGAWQELFRHFTDQAMTTPAFRTPMPTRPDRKDMPLRPSSWQILPLAPRIRARLLFLSDARAISQAELLLDFVDHYRLGEIVGGPSAGVDGNVNPFETGGLRISWTGMKVDKHDGRPLNGVGILPTVPVARTLEGIRAGRDEILEKALELATRPGR